MPTTEQEKPAIKPRQRSRKADQRKEKGEQKIQAGFDPAAQASESVSAMVTPVEEAPVEDVPKEIAPVAAMEEIATEEALSGEVLPPDVHHATSQALGFQAIAQAYGDYTKKSWLTGRFLVERLIVARSFEEAIEIQGEFARQTYANFIAQSQKIGELYGEWALQFLRPFDKFTTGWSRIAR
jgi:hypothetical protein